MKRICAIFISVLSLISCLVMAGCQEDKQTDNKTIQGTVSPSQDAPSESITQEQGSTTAATDDVQEITPEEAPVDFTGIEPAPESDFRCMRTPEKQIYILEYTGSDTVVVVPDTIQGMPVVSVCMGKGKDFEGVKIPEGVTMINEDAFMKCTKLRTVILPSTLTGIESRAFYEAVNLKTIELPEGLQEIRSEAFFSTQLEKVVVPSTVSYIGRMAFDARIKELTILDGDVPLTLGPQSMWDHQGGIYRIPARATTFEAIYDDDRVFHESATIICPAGSAAENYCKEYGFNYQTAE